MDTNDEAPKMNAAKTCSQCGAALPVHAPGERCPRCLLQFALDPAAAEAGVAPDPAHAHLHYFGDYELVSVIARGGMGVVYKARQVSLNRVVAVKMLLAGHFSSDEYVRRFRTEAEAAANLRHPNIVAILEVGEHEGRQYFSMEYVKGQNLAALVQDQPLPAKRAARLVQSIAEAIHYAHQRGVIHRDLKPSNVLLAEDDQPRVTDFGLAKFVAGNDQTVAVPNGKLGGRDSRAATTKDSAASQLTVTGQVLGTPGFMPPEQASGRRGAVTRSSDIYSLGAILYFVLTARAPFAADSLEAILRQVLESDPVSPRLLNDSIPCDLETICLKCLEKAPHSRFASAQELADELGRFLDGKPIHARPASPPEKLWRWCQRKPAIAMLVGALLGALILGGLGIHWQLRQAQAGELAARRNAYVADMNLAQASVDANNLRRARELLDRHRPQPGQEDLRGWEWRRIWHETQSGALAIYPSGLKRPVTMCFMAGNTQLVLGTPGGDIVRLDFGNQLPVPKTALPKSGQVAVVAASRDGKLLAVTGKRGVVHVWDREDSPLPVSLQHTNQIASLSFSADGEWLAVSVFDGTVRIWDWRNGALLRTERVPRAEAMYFGDVAFAPVGRALAIGQANGRLRLIDASTGEEKCNVAAHKEQISAMAFSPDGRLIASGSGYTESIVRVWDAATGEAVGELKGHTSWISGLAFSPDGACLASSSADQTVRLWETNSWRELKTYRGHLKEVHCLAFSADGKKLASADQDGIINLWDTRPDGRQNYPVIVRGAFIRPFFSPDDTRLFVLDQGEIIVYDVTTFRELDRLAALGTNNNSIALSPDGRMMAVAGKNGQLKLWDVNTRRELTNFLAHTKGISGVGFTPDGRTLTSLGFDRLVKHWQLSDWSLTSSWEWQPELTFYRSSLQPRHHLWATLHEGQVKLWNLADGRLIAALPTEDSFVDDVDISPDGKWLVAGMQNGSVTIFNTQTWQAHVTLRGHLTGVHGVAFSPDGTRLATGSNGREAVKLWDTATWQELATLPGQGSLFRVLFSPGGTTLAASGAGRRMNLWRAPSFEEIQRAEKVSTLTRTR